MKLICIFEKSLHLDSSGAVKLPVLWRSGCYLRFPNGSLTLEYLFIENPQTHPHEFHVWCMSHRPASHQARQAVLQSTADGACTLCSSAGVLFDLLDRDKALLRGCFYLRSSLWWVLSFVRVELCACSISLNKHHISFSTHKALGCWTPALCRSFWQVSTQSKAWMQWILFAVSCKWGLGGSFSFILRSRM